MGLCKKDITPLLTHWSYVFLELTHRYLDVEPVKPHFTCSDIEEVNDFIREHGYGESRSHLTDWVVKWDLQAYTPGQRYWYCNSSPDHHLPLQSTALKPQQQHEIRGLFISDKMSYGIEILQTLKAPRSE